eukprot:461217-Hanusia_phi.AAC.1
MYTVQDLPVRRRKLKLTSEKPLRQQDIAIEQLEYEEDSRCETTGGRVAPQGRLTRFEEGKEVK